LSDIPFPIGSVSELLSVLLWVCGELSNGTDCSTEVSLSTTAGELFEELQAVIVMGATIPIATMAPVLNFIVPFTREIMFERYDVTN